MDAASALSAAAACLVLKTISIFLEDKRING